jgi:hypothetical protein
VYHRTTRAGAAAIFAQQAFTSKEQGWVFVSTRSEGEAAGYGDAVVVLEVPARLMTLDDEFPDGERHYRVPATEIDPAFIRGVRA